MNYMPSRSCRIQPRNFVPQPRDFRSQPLCGRQELLRRENTCSDKIEETDIYTHADQLPLAMAYVPFQRFSNTFNLQKGLEMGTIFPELCKPFCGKRGVGKR